MKIKLDENMSATLADRLIGMGHDVETVPQEGLAGVDDDGVWAVAQAESRFLITQDLDFSDSRKFIPGTHSGLLLVRLRNPGRMALTRRVISLFQTEDVEGWSRCFVVSTERKVRVKRP